MIKQLRKKFIRIAMLAVTSVLLLLCIIVNLANFLSVNSQLNEMLSVIQSNQGSLPPMPRGDKPPDDDKKPKQDGQFTQETAYSTRYFVLRFTSDGQLVRADLDKIAAVTQDDTDEYVQIALKHGEGFGYTSGYKYYVTDDGDGRYTAIFLDCYRDVRSMITLAVLSVAAMAINALFRSEIHLRRAACPRGSRENRRRHSRRHGRICSDSVKARRGLRLHIGVQILCNRRRGRKIYGNFS